MNEEQVERVVTTDTLPDEIAKLVDERAGREHSRNGMVMRTVVEVINLWETMRGRGDV